MKLVRHGTQSDGFERKAEAVSTITVRPAVPRRNKSFVCHSSNGPTTSRAGALVTAPKAFVPRMLYQPVFVGSSSTNCNDLLVAIGTGWPFLSHWKTSGPAPAAPAVSVAVPLAKPNAVAGLKVIRGGPLLS